MISILTYSLTTNPETETQTESKRVQKIQRIKPRTKLQIQMQKLMWAKTKKTNQIILTALFKLSFGFSFSFES